MTAAPTVPDEPPHIRMRCTCGRTVTLRDVRRWPLMQGWIGDCPVCNHSPVVTDEELKEAS